MNLTQTQQDDRVAQTIIGCALGVDVRVHDNGSESSMYDLAFEYVDGRTVAAEIVSNRQPTIQKTWNQVNRVGFVPDARLSRIWTVTVHHGSEPMKLKRRLADLLQKLEAENLTEIDELDLYDIFDNPDQDWADISAALSRTPSPGAAPGFSMRMTAWTGWLGDGDDALGFVEEQIANEWHDVTRKLNSTGRDEAHVVVLLADDVIGPMWAIEEGKTPTRDPILPQEIDGLWIVARGRFPLRAVYCLSGKDWRDVEITPDDYLAVCTRNAE